MSDSSAVPGRDRSPAPRHTLARAILRASAVLAIAGVGMAICAQQRAAWTVETVNDELHGRATQRLTARGVYLIGGADSSGDWPALVLVCRDGAYRDAALYVGALVQSGRTLGGQIRVDVEKRLDGKFTSTLWAPSEDGLSLSIGFRDLAKFIHGHSLIVGVHHNGEGYPVQMKFEIPDPAPVLQYCGKTKQLR